MSTTTSSRNFDIGDQPTFVWTFRDENDVLTTPLAVTFSQIAPDGTRTDENLGNATEESVGVLSWQIPAPFNAAGTWKYRVAATSGVVVAEELTVKVRKSAFA
jgi:hypothetical protein